MKLSQPSFLKSISLSHKNANDSLQDKKCSFLLMSEKKAVTPWHTDFSHTSVVYILLSGVKEFLIFERNSTNLQAFLHYKTLNNPLVSLIVSFLINISNFVSRALKFVDHPGLTSSTRRVVLLKNQGLIMLGGTVRMVRTSETAVAYSLNFLLETQFSE